MPSATRYSPLLVALTLATGCATMRSGTVECRAPLPPAGPTTGLVFCADGAGGFGGTTAALRRVLGPTRPGMRVEMVDWSHGRGMVLADHLNAANIEDHGTQLARQVLAWRTHAPNVPVYLVAHSAGAAVVLSAADQLPPGSVERIILLAPAVSADYDLRPARERRQESTPSPAGATGGARAGDAAVRHHRPAMDRRRRPGRVPAGGVRPVRRRPVRPAPPAHAWHACLTWTGHAGGHYSCCDDGFLRASVLPLLAPTVAAAEIGGNFALRLNRPADGRLVLQASFDRRLHA
ncbi:MAG: alpha/beta hydrolase [Gemmataceae bacterium]